MLTDYYATFVTEVSAHRVASKHGLTKPTVKPAFSRGALIGYRIKFTHFGTKTLLTNEQLERMEKPHAQ